jgi:hypothetical protein
MQTGRAAYLREFERIAARVDREPVAPRQTARRRIRRAPCPGGYVRGPHARGCRRAGAPEGGIAGIVELARSLGPRLVAEGVELPEQHAMLRALGCALGQGFLFARPLEVEQLRELLGQWRDTRVVDARQSYSTFSVIRMPGAWIVQTIL